MKQYTFTQQGYDEKQQELADLREKRKDAVKELSWARDLGDRSENAAYKSARWKLSSIDRQIRYYEKILRKAQIVEAPKGGVIGIGSFVTVSVNGCEVSYQIVGGEESDLAKQRISFLSPIARALMGKKEGDKVTVRIPAGEKVYEVIKIA